VSSPDMTFGESKLFVRLCKGGAVVGSATVREPDRTRLHDNMSTVRLRALVLVVLPVSMRLANREPVMEPIARCRT